MSMATVRDSVVSTPLHHASSLSRTDTPLLRCHDCAGYADPTATHSDCTFRGIRKAGYAGACGSAGSREPNGRPRRAGATASRPRVITVTPTRKDMSMNEQHDVLNAWTPAEDATLRKFAHEGRAEVEQRLNRSSSAIQQRAAKLGVSLAKRKVDRTVAEAASVDSPAPTSTSGNAPTISVVSITPVDDSWPHTIVTTADIEAEADEFAEAVTTGVLLAMARAEIAELRIELMMIALRDRLGDDAEAFAAEFIFPAVEAAENAAGVSA